MVEKLTIKGWAEEDRPREKLLLKGKSVLSEAELIAILIGSGNNEQSAVELSQYILTTCENSLNNLAKLSVKDLQKFKGIGEAKAVSIVAALELGRRRKEAEPNRRLQISSSKDVYDLVQGDLLDLKYEEFWVLFLKRNNDVIKKEMISRGGMSGTVVDAKIVYKRALEESAAGIIAVHNHPSGQLKPSHDDKRLTRKLKDAGAILDVSFLDHVIVTDHGFYSFADENML